MSGRLLLVCGASVVISDQDGSLGVVLRGSFAHGGYVLWARRGLRQCLLWAAGIADVHGPLLLRYGATKLANPATPAQQVALRPLGREQWTCRLGWGRIPGFAVSGLPGPGRQDFRLR